VSDRLFIYSLSGRCYQVRTGASDMGDVIGRFVTMLLTIG